MGSFEFLPNIDAVLDSQSGMVGDYMASLGRRVERGAKERVPVKTGRLRSAIEWGWTGRGLEVEVAANTNYAAAVHNGSRPHTITPTRAKVLRFPTKGGAVVFTNKVNHPGSKPVPFLTDALAEVL